MPTVPSTYVRTLSDAIDQLSADARAVADARLEEILATTQDPFELADLVSQMLEPLLDGLTGNTGSLAATFYDTVRLLMTGEAFGAKPYKDRNPQWTRDAIYGIASNTMGNPAAFTRAVLDRVDYEAKRAAGSTMFSNGAYDPKKPRFARMPTGRETCAFCNMLASRGFVYNSERSAGKLDHYHTNCKCRVIPQFGRGSYEGYDPDYYLDLYARDLESGKLDPERLARSSEKAKKRNREQRDAENRRRDTEITESFEANHAATYEARGPSGNLVTLSMLPSSLGDMMDAEPDLGHLGFTQDDRAALARELARRTADHDYTERNARYGLYEQTVRLSGPNGRSARAVATWSVKQGFGALVDLRVDQVRSPKS